MEIKRQNMSWQDEIDEIKRREALAQEMGVMNAFSANTTMAD